MRTATEVYKWFQHPHWTWWLAWRAYAAAVVVTWVGVHWLFPTLTFGTVLILGPVIPLAGLVAWFGFDLGQWLVRRIRLTVDAGIPLSPVRMARDLASERKKFADHETWWAKFCSGQKIAWDGQAPRLHRMQQTATGDVRARVNPAGLGGDLEAITRLAANGVMAGIMHCQEVSVQPSGGKAWLTFYKTPPLQRSFTLADLPGSGKGRMTFGIDESGEVAAVKHGLSVLIGGITGAGKSMLFWNMFADILRDGLPTEMWFVDPKRTEFLKFKPFVGKRIGNIKIMGYCTDAEEAVPMLDRFADEMLVRQDRMGEMGLAVIEKPTEDFPVRIFVVDELIDVIPAFSKGSSSMHVVVRKGRATLDSVIGLTQLAKIETLGSIRDFFPLRVCLRTATRQNTEAVLAVGENDGPACSRIPLGMPGVGYYVTEQGVVRKFRTAKVSDRQRDQLVSGNLPEGMPVNVDVSGPPGYTYVGRDKKGAVMYVGFAGGWTKGLITPVERRRREHRHSDRKWCAEHDRVENWWNVHVVDTHLKIDKYPSEAAALIAEERLIKELKPRFNKHHNGANPDSNEAMMRRASMGWRVRDAVGEYRLWGREHRELRRVQLAAAHQERVARLQEERDQFVQTVTEQAA